MSRFRPARPPFVDAHAHFHDHGHPRLRWSWLEPGGDAEETAQIGPYGAIRAERYAAEEYLAETRFQGVAKVVHVQAALGSPDPVEETAWLQASADRLGAPHAIVGYVDLARPDAGEAIARHAAFANFRGVRDLRYDDYLTNPAWERGLALLAARELVCCDDPDLAQAALARRLVERHPGLTYCVDHAGFPKQRTAASFAAWRSAIRELAQAPNAVVKISGLGQADHRWTVDSLRPYVLESIEAFGVERAFFGTNWPIDRLYGSYGDLLDAYDEIIAGFSAAERTALFAGNAARVFGLGEVA
ncbi:MAG TPA: amidohydrolase family protein [Conexibacter sp.]|nr:amidohydrolase family protein [Conexibacter sp.]